MVHQNSETPGVIFNHIWYTYDLLLVFYNMFMIIFHARSTRKLLLKLISVVFDYLYISPPSHRPQRVIDMSYDMDY